MKRLSYSFETNVRFDIPVDDHAFVLRCLPPSTAVQKTDGHVELDPPTSTAVQHDGFGNTLVVGYLSQPHDHFSYRAYGSVVVDRSREPVDDIHPMYRFASPLTHVSDEMRAFLAEHPARDGEDDRERCAELSHLVHETLAYQKGTTDISTTAAEAFAQRSGVCQDYAHVLIALLRAEGIPARYVSGLTLGEGATHAWVQAHIDRRWAGFDPTRDVAVDDGYLTMAVGRDWSDCPIERATFQGFARQTQTVCTQVTEM